MKATLDLEEDTAGHRRPDNVGKCPHDDVVVTYVSPGCRTADISGSNTCHVL